MVHALLLGMNTAHTELDSKGLATLDRASRVEWVGERLWDYAEGSLSLDALRMLGVLVQGWTDLATEEERRQYRGLCRQIASMVSGS